ncbi:54S ribosomal protein L36, mitochondrial [Sorochytrium milnesiophthora]
MLLARLTRSLVRLPSLAANLPAASAVAAALTFGGVRAYQVRASVRVRCEHCYMVKRKGRLYVLCKKDATHKQRQG